MSITDSFNEYNIYQYTGKTINHTINLLSRKKKRDIAVRVNYLHLKNDRDQFTNNINIIKYNYLIKIFNKSSIIINRYFKNNYIKKLNKKTKIYKKLNFIKIYKNKNSLCLDLIEKILN